MKDRNGEINRFYRHESGQNSPKQNDPDSQSRVYTPVQRLFLRRLHDMKQKRIEYGNSLSADDWRLKLLSKAIYSTFCDCVEQGMKDEARDLLKY